jgi:hypothetical protein
MEVREKSAESQCQLMKRSLLSQENTKEALVNQYEKNLMEYRQQIAKLTQ